MGVAQEKRRGPKWNPGKWKGGLRPAYPQKVDFEPYPNDLLRRHARPLLATARARRGTGGTGGAGGAVGRLARSGAFQQRTVSGFGGGHWIGDVEDGVSVGLEVEALLAA